MDRCKTDAEGGLGRPSAADLAVEAHENECRDARENMCLLYLYFVSPCALLSALLNRPWLWCCPRARPTLFSSHSR
jgi:hypothetical protein